MSPWFKLVVGREESRRNGMRDLCSGRVFLDWNLPAMDLRLLNESVSTAANFISFGQSWWPRIGQEAFRLARILLQDLTSDTRLVLQPHPWTSKFYLAQILKGYEHWPTKPFGCEHALSIRLLSRQLFNEDSTGVTESLNRSLQARGRVYQIYQQESILSLENLLKQPTINAPTRVYATKSAKTRSRDFLLDLFQKHWETGLLPETVAKLLDRMPSVEVKSVFGRQERLTFRLRDPVTGEILFDEVVAYFFTDFNGSSIDDHVRDLERHFETLSPATKAVYVFYLGNEAKKLSAQVESLQNRWLQKGRTLEIRIVEREQLARLYEQARNLSV